LISTGHFLKTWPIENAPRTEVDKPYRYGSTLGGTLDPHIGIDITNSEGTPVVAAADGKIVVARNDRETAYGPYVNYYGNTIIIEHKLSSIQSPVYSLYGHLSDILVSEGEIITSGDIIGSVGASGAALGSHLHFEIRVGENSYLNTRNPELWLPPRNDDDGVQNGTLVGFILDRKNRLLDIYNIVLEYIPEEGSKPISRIYLSSYLGGIINNDDWWGESFGVGDISSGLYKVSFQFHNLYEQLVEVIPGKVTVVGFCLNGD
jgi:murein DD-endopeptidase MepM/ murein hydrolase activator NlpD